MKRGWNAQNWELTMAEAVHIASIPSWKGSDAAIAMEYGVGEELVHEIRTEKAYKRVNLRS